MRGTLVVTNPLSRRLKYPCMSSNNLVEDLHLPNVQKGRLTKGNAEEEYNINMAVAL
jgi:hypothetical protein